MTDKKRGLGRGLGALIPTSDGPSVVTEALLTPHDGPDGLRVERHEAQPDELAYYRAAVFVPPPGPDSQGAREIAARFGGASGQPVAGEDA